MNLVFISLIIVSIIPVVIGIGILTYALILLAQDL